MANFKYYENDYELAVFQMLEQCGWEYQCGYDIHRTNDEVILVEDFREYLSRRYDYFSDDKLAKLVSYVTSLANQSLYRAMKETYKLQMRGYTLHRDDGNDMFVEFFDFDGDSNVFKAVNQYEFQEFKNRRPDIILFVNGIPVSAFELKNPADETVSIVDAYKQPHIRYAQDIPSLMKYDLN